MAYDVSAVIDVAFEDLLECQIIGWKKLQFRAVGLLLDPVPTILKTNLFFFFFFSRVLYNWVCLNASAFGCERLLLKQPCDILAACSHGVRKEIHMQRHKTKNLL